MDNVINPACEILDKNEAISIATIIRHQGSTPRTAGTRMILSKNGREAGTIGGGILEARVIEAAKDVFADRRSRILSFDLTKNSAADVDMICGGQVDVLLAHVYPDRENRSLFRRWQKALSDGEKCLLATVVSRIRREIQNVERFLVLSDRRVFGGFSLPSSIRDEQIFKNPKSPFEIMELENTTVIVEASLPKARAYILGAGHVAQPLAHLASLAGFSVSVLDDRVEFAHADRFPDAHEIHVLNHFDEAFSGRLIDSNSYIIIITRGHFHDQAVLSLALTTEAGYIGMIGSRRKRDAIYKSLGEAGFSEAELNRVHSPIGLDIGAETPFEIAVSIVGELIQTRSKKKS